MNWESLNLETIDLFGSLFTFPSGEVSNVVIDSENYSEGVGYSSTIPRSGNFAHYYLKENLSSGDIIVSQDGITRYQCISENYTDEAGVSIVPVIRKW